MIIDVDEPEYPEIGGDEELATDGGESASEPLHDPLFPPGRILYLNRVAPTDSQPSEVRLESVLTNTCCLCCA